MCGIDCTLERFAASCHMGAQQAPNQQLHQLQVYPEHAVLLESLKLAAFRSGKGSNCHQHGAIQ